MLHHLQSLRGIPVSQQNPEKNTELAMLYFEAAQRAYALREWDALPNTKDTLGLPPSEDLEGFEACFESDDKGILTLKADLPIGNLRIEICQGKMLVFQQGFGPALYGYRLQLIDGAPMWLMTHRWVVQEFSNPNYPPAYVDYLLDLLGRLIDHAVVQYFPQDEGTPTWVEQVTEGRSVESFAGIRTTPELAEAYLSVAHGLWTLSQQEGGIRFAKPEVVKEVWNESIDTIRPFLPALH